MRRRLPFSYSVRSAVARRTRTALTVGVIALVVLSVLLMLSLVSGIQRTLVQSGLDDNLIVLRKGATNDGSSMLPIEAYRAVQYFPGIARDPASDEPLVSPEMIVQPFFYRTDGGRENVLVRGVRAPLALAVHRNVRIAEGRAPRASSGEAVIGRAVAARYRGATLGESLHFGRGDWKVVGILDADGTSFDSEVWVDVNDLWNDANRSVYSGLRIRVAPDADAEALVRRIGEDARWALEAKPETEYYREQSESASFLYLLTVILAVIMGTGAVFGAMNTMFASVKSRTAEIGTLRALGFSRGSILASFVVESLVISALGFVAGAVLALVTTAALTAWLQGVAINLSTFTTATVALRLGAGNVAAAGALAIVLGAAGGFLPARAAARLSPAEALRRS